MLNILYLGPDTGTSSHRCRALQRLGHSVKLVDAFQAFPKGRFFGMWGFKTGFFGFDKRMTDYVLGSIGDSRYDVVWVDNGETIGGRLVGQLKSRTKFILNHNLDNPYTRRDGGRWRLFKKALPLYDLVVTPRETSRVAALEAGARRAMAVTFTADEKVHRRTELTEDDKAVYASEVAFVGTWMPERGPFMQRLLERGVPLKVFGVRWEKAPEFDRLAAVVSSRMLGDVDYVKAISGAKIALGLLSVGNEDLHTTRSLEIPSIGSLLCAQRTSEHEAFYKDGVEAVFFDDADQCADLCLSLLSDPDRIRTMSDAGHRRAIENGRFNEALCSEILAALPIH